MSQEQLSHALAKVMISAAWADGEIQPQEMDYLKEFILQMPGMDEDKWEGLDVYICMPIEEEERVQLIDDLKEHIKTEKDQNLVLRSLEMVFEADGVISPTEQYTINQIKKHLGIQSDEDTGDRD